MRLLVLYAQQIMVSDLLPQQPEAPERRQWLAAGESANRQLLLLDASATACLHFKRGILMAASSSRGPEAMAAYRLALHEAAEHKCEGCMNTHRLACSQIFYNC
jgi:hypothetical protein